MAFGRYTHAVVCRVPNSIKECSSGLIGDINVELARKEHEEFCKTLRSLDLDVIELQADESTPDCAFVDDTAIICNGAALICRPANGERQKELDIIRATIKKELGIAVMEIRDPMAIIQGGNVLFTGREFFVGISAWTNEAGARALAAAFPEYPVTPVKLPKRNHLKALLSMAGPDVICLSDSPEAQAVKRQVEREATFQYQTVTLPEERAAGCLYINGRLLHRHEFPNANQEFAQKIDYGRVTLAVTELSKGSTGLPSLALLVRKSRHH
ncbi:N(G),N(G)-dimethylarginine dimethylaminohydrolase 1 [Dermacentor andersoni]|uniref:N(G),N(G)-dimethylarginine dimethylaminohydrolase 1 n=1 Tax=Dermacentor andersoni TaxID=34620 RepID=UPI002155808F|nr:N(G),N(G)-dimethylarginine dimethylaminohydrolase 1-like [Dermacentor andersoni]